MQNPTTHLLTSLADLLRPARRTERVLATSLATELRTLPDLPQQVLALARASRRERNASLLRTARTFRGEWNTLGAADALKRMATKPGLFDAVARELCAA